MTIHIASISGIFVLAASTLFTPSWDEQDAQNLAHAGARLHDAAHLAHSSGVPCASHEGCGVHGQVCPTSLEEARSEYEDLQSSLLWTQRFESVSGWGLLLGVVLASCLPIRMALGTWCR